MKICKMTSRKPLPVYLISFRKDFFRSGEINMGKGTVSDDLRKEIATTASVELQAIGYDLTK